MIQAIFRGIALCVACGAYATTLLAAPVTYVIDPSHTFPAFEADHWGGRSVWRGKIEHSSGTVILDREAQSGTVNVSMEMASINFGHEGMNEHAKSGEILGVEEFPIATYVGKLANFKNGAPTAVEGTLTMHGVTKPVNLTVNSFKCEPHVRTKREVCGADATATINREEFGVDYDKENGFFMDVKLLITIEAMVAAD
jgi:polyisoprenoid-binding protein YceI